MDIFYSTFGFVGAICLGIIILTLFFMCIGRFKRMTRKIELHDVKGFIRDDKQINVHLTGGKSIVGVRFLGITGDSTKEGELPYHLRSMLVLERPKGERILIRSDSVKAIEEVEDSRAQSGD